MKIAIIGAGNMGGAIARGLYASGLSKANDLFISNAHEEKLKAIAKDIPGIYTTTDNREIIKKADCVMLAVKPWLIKDVIEGILPELDFHKQTIVSIAAGISLQTLAVDLKSKDYALFRVLPNTAIALRASMTFISSQNASQKQEEELLNIFNQLGKAIIIPEGQMGAMTSVSSCGIAYILRFIRAASEGAVELGVRADVAHEVVAQTMIGAAQLIMTNHSNPEAEIDKVTTPGGWTIKGLNAMEDNGFTKSVIAGIKANK